MKSQDLTKLKLPPVPGVYFFRSGKPSRPGDRSGGDILYIGKATSLRDRTKSYFAKDLIKTRGPSIVDMVFKSDTVTFEETDSVLEALILEAELIRKFQPHYNVKEKDGKSFLVVGITKEDFPQVLSIRKKDLSADKKSAKIERGKREVKLQAVYGPFTSGGSLREALKIIRRIFPFRDQYSSKKDNYEFYRQLGLTPELGEEAAKEKYQKTIRNIKLFFEGKKKQIVRELKKEMMMHAKRQEFELADEVKKTVFALEHINDIALMKSDFLDSYTMLSSSFRIEAYDIAHMSGKNMVGVMTVLVNGTPDKNEYRKFIIRSQSGSNDTGALEEVLSRRLRHTEWGMPDLIVIDGGVGQLNIAKQVLFRYQMKIPLVSVVKDDKHKAREILGDKEYATKYAKEIVLANSESHRFAIDFHKQKRNKNFLS